MLVTFKDLQRVGVSRWNYRRAIAEKLLRPAKLKVRYTYPRFWSWDAEKAFNLQSGCLAGEKTRRRVMQGVMGTGWERRKNGKTEDGTAREGGR